LPETSPPLPGYPHVLQDAYRRQAEQQNQERQEQEQRRQENFWRQAATFMSQGSSCWEVLGVPPTASMVDVQSHYRELVKQHHPDRGGDANLFMRVQEAYDQARAILEGR
jgi:DnaJ-domain-containing protein 1